MFTQADLNQAAVKGHNLDQSAIEIARAVKNNQQRIRNYFESVDKRVMSGALILKVLASVGYAAGEDNYEDIEWACRRKVAGIGSALKLSSVGEFGQLHNGQFIPNQDELITLVARPVDPDLHFQDYTPCTFLYHEYTNLNWQLGNNKPRGLAIIEINLVALIWQYTKAVSYYRRSGIQITTGVYADRHILSRMLPSYMDIAYLNIHRRLAMELEIEADLPTRVIPVPALQRLAIKSAENIRRNLLNGSPLPAVVLIHIPQFFTEPDRNAVDRVLFKDGGMTIQGQWPREIVNWYWALFCYQYDNPAMQKFKSNLQNDLDRFADLNVLNKLPKAMYNYIRHSLLFPLYTVLENQN